MITLHDTAGVQLLELPPDNPDSPIVFPLGNEAVAGIRTSTTGTILWGGFSQSPITGTHGQLTLGERPLLYRDIQSIQTTLTLEGDYSLPDGTSGTLTPIV